MYSEMQNRLSKTRESPLEPMGQIISSRCPKRVFTIYGHGGHLGHVTRIMSSDFHILVPESFHKIFGSDRQSSF